MTNPTSDTQMNQSLVNPDSNTVPTVGTTSTSTPTTSETLVRAVPGALSEHASSMSEDERLKVELLAEELHVEKGVRQMGEVTFSKRIIEEEVQVPVTLRREEVTMTRRDVSAPVETDSMATASGEQFEEAFTEQTIVIRLYEEVPQITKVARVSGEVEISKRVVTRDKNLLNTVRREELQVDAPDNVVVHDDEKAV